MFKLVHIIQLYHSNELSKNLINSSIALHCIYNYISNSNARQFARESSAPQRERRDQSQRAVACRLRGSLPSVPTSTTIYLHLQNVNKTMRVYVSFKNVE
jgi:hypothetical protein